MNEQKRAAEIVEKAQVAIGAIYDKQVVVSYRVLNGDADRAETIIELCSMATGVSVKNIIGNARSAEVVNARFSAMYLIRSILKLSLKEIGRVFNNRDHSTVLHALSKIDELIESPKRFIRRHGVFSKCREMVSKHFLLGEPANADIFEGIAESGFYKVRKENTLYDMESRMKLLREQGRDVSAFKECMDIYVKRYGN